MRSRSCISIVQVFAAYSGVASFANLSPLSSSDPGHYLSAHSFRYSSPFCFRIGDSVRIGVSDRIARVRVVALSVLSSTVSVYIALRCPVPHSPMSSCRVGYPSLPLSASSSTSAPRSSAVDGAAAASPRSRLFIRERDRDVLLERHMACVREDGEHSRSEDAPPYIQCDGFPLDVLDRDVGVLHLRLVRLV